MLSVLWKGGGVLRVPCQLFLELGKNLIRFLPHGIQQYINIYKTPQKNKEENLAKTKRLWTDLRNI